MMVDYELEDFELNGKKTVIAARGVAELMSVYLPWPVLDINIKSSARECFEVIDNQTDFKYMSRVI